MECSIDGCNNDVKARGWCIKHYKRWIRHGDPNIKKNKRGQGYINSNGYRELSRNCRRVFEHREVMEEFLGRRLRDDETVHHRNGDRLDNRIANLELRVSNHGAGQGVTDLVQWAKEILKLYESDAQRLTNP